MTRSLLDRVIATLPTVSGGRWIVVAIAGECPQCGEALLSEPNGTHCDQCGWEHDGSGNRSDVIAIAADWLPDPERLHHVTHVRCHAADLLLAAGFYLEGRAANTLWICDDSAAPSDRGADPDAALNRYLAASDALRELRGPVVRIARPELEAWHDKHGSEE